MLPSPSLTRSNDTIPARYPKLQPHPPFPATSFPCGPLGCAPVHHSPPSLAVCPPHPNKLALTADPALSACASAPPTCVPWAPCIPCPSRRCRAAWRDKCHTQGQGAWDTGINRQHEMRREDARPREGVQGARSSVEQQVGKRNESTYRVQMPVLRIASMSGQNVQDEARRLNTANTCDTRGKVFRKIGTPCDQGASP